MEIDEVSEIVISEAIDVHRGLGPGLLESVEQLSRSHAKQLQTYVRLTKQARWLLLNFSGATMKEGIRRVVNDSRQPQATSASPREPTQRRLICSTSQA